MSKEKDNKQSTDEARRDFLRKSVYAAYATPVIVALLVEKASASQSACPPGRWDASGPNGGCCTKSGYPDSCQQ